MGMRIIDTPPELKGKEIDQLRQVHRYLFSLSEKLNVCLNKVEITDQAPTILRSGSGTSAADRREAEYSAKELRELIINTAEIVRSEMSRLETVLQSKYTALSSSWGSYQETINTTIEATAMNIIANYDYSAILSELSASVAGFEQYQSKMEGYIKQGIIGIDDDGLPILGIAIGKTLNTETYVVDGVEYEKISDGQTCAFYTDEGISFFVNGTEKARFTGDTLEILNVKVGTLDVGEAWAVYTDTDGSFAIDWIGG